MLNQALELEHAARVQYLVHAEQVDGLNAEPIIARLKELAEDKKKHEEIFREMVGSYLGGVPSMNNLKESLLEESRRGEESHRRYIAGEVHGEIGEGMRACHDYGRVFGERLGS